LLRFRKLVGYTMSDTITLPRERVKEKEEHKTKKQPPYHVILHNDDDHSFDYVIIMMRVLFGHPPEKGFQIAEEVHTRGRVIVTTTSLELAELKRDQIHAFGPDPLIPRCKGSMSASIEPAEG
jgi:ATP-dependent Clp protease adaptor protein ClpS